MNPYRTFPVARRTAALLMLAALLAACAAPAAPLSNPSSARETPSAAVAATATALPLTIAGPRLAAGAAHTCSLTSGGAVWCWGANANGQLGDGGTQEQRSPVAVTGLAEEMRALAAGAYHTCALSAAGRVYCWGQNQAGQLGDGGLNDQRAPVAVRGLDGPMVAVSAGYGHTCALAAGGRVYCWGQNLFGQLGNGDTHNSTTPTEVSGLQGAVAIAAGAEFTCALLSSGQVQCWGQNSAGQLGAPAPDSSATPLPVTQLPSGLIGLTAGWYHACVLQSGGGVLCWGASDGLGTPVSVGGLEGPAAAVTAGAGHTCALLHSGAVQCWGDNFYGQLGTAGFESSGMATSGVAKSVLALTDPAVEIAAGAGHTCIMTGDERVLCWGDDSFGQLGPNRLLP